jgi:hypothetical protein
MRTFAYLLFFVPTFCAALGAEDTLLVGFSEGEKLVQLGYKDDSQDWSDGSPVYGSSEPGVLAFCWGTKVNEVPTKFSCSPTKGSKPSIIYDALPIPLEGAHPPKQAPYADEYKKLSQKAKLGDGTKQGDGIVLTIYKCSHGCSSGVPPRLYKVGIFD